MKALSLVLMATLGLSATANACGGSGGGDEFTGKAAAYAAMDGVLTCHSNGTSSIAKIGVFALYKCMGSPVYGEIEAFGEKRKLEAVTQLNPTTFEISTLGSSTAILCQLQKPNVSRESRDKARAMARDIYERIVGLSAGRQYEITTSETSKVGGSIIETLTIRATLESSRREDTTPYDIKIKLVDGNLTEVSAKPALQ